MRSEDKRYLNNVQTYSNKKNKILIDGDIKKITSSFLYVSGGYIL
jgi:hypothetical protein